MSALVVTLQLNPEEFKYEESEGQGSGDIIEQEGWFQNAINSLRTE